jgi:hypothetical protein
MPENHPWKFWKVLMGGNIPWPEAVGFWAGFCCLWLLLAV